MPLHPPNPSHPISPAPCHGRTPILPNTITSPTPNHLPTITTNLTNPRPTTHAPYTRIPSTLKPNNQTRNREATKGPKQARMGVRLQKNLTNSPPTFGYPKDSIEKIYPKQTDHLPEQEAETLNAPPKNPSKPRQSQGSPPKHKWRSDRTTTTTPGAEIR